MGGGRPARGALRRGHARGRRAAGEEEPAAPGEGERREVEAHGADRATLFAHWLGELAFLAETQSFVPDEVAEVECDGGRVRAQVSGHLASPPHLVKAVTYHRLRFEEQDGRWHARAVLDV